MIIFQEKSLGKILMFNFAEKFYKRAQECLQRNDVRGALACFDEVLEINPKDEGSFLRRTESGNR